MSEQGEPSKEISRWADRAMFSAEPIEKQEGIDGVMPKVYLLDPPNDPLGHIAAACMMYEGRVVRDLAGVTDQERANYFQQVKKTKLQAPFEFIDLHFMIEGVTRAFTHQIVRQRTAVYAQESLRFAVKEGMAGEVALPPSLVGVRLPEHETLEDLLTMALSPQQQQLVVWLEEVQKIEGAYNYLINSGMPAEDARGLLPHSVTTRLHYKTNLRNLIEHAGNRLCTQAQFEWRLVLSQLTQAVRRANGGYFTAQGPANSGWQWELITHDVFKPACFLAGHCPFEANFDRHCSIRGRVREFAQHGVPSSRWERGARVDKGGWFEDIEPIRREEWLLDPAAARVR